MFETVKQDNLVVPVINQDRISMDENQFLSKLKNKKIFLILPAIAVVILGVFTGYFVSSKKTSSSGTATQAGVVSGSEIQVGAEFGGKDGSAFPDQALGVIEAGGIDGEGTHKLQREGGPSQTVYLTSSTLDLEQFTGRKVQIWGETFKAQKAGWLMDVGRLKVLE